jgi:SPP1 family predicted phage head-tail adaptor
MIGWYGNYFPDYFWETKYWPDGGAPSTLIAPVLSIFESFGMIKGLFNKEVLIYNVTESVSTLTGENLKTNSVGTSLKCRIMPVTRAEIFRANKNNLEVKHRLYCHMSTWFNEGDRILYDSETYEITGMKNPDELDHFLQVDYKLVK